MYQRVETLKKTYLCKSVTEEGSKNKLAAALAIDTDEGANELAKKYIKAQLTGQLKTVTVSASSTESVEDAEEESVFIDLMEKYLPLAEKNARVNAILAELDTLLGDHCVEQEDD